MNTDLIRRILILILFVVAQVLVLNNIHIFNCATPLLYVYYVITFPRNHTRWITILLSFLLGLCVDTFTNTPGLACASMTLIAFLQPYILELFLDREDADDFVPAVKTMGWMRFIIFSMIITFIYCLVFFSLEAFNFFNWIQWLLCIVTSYLLTMALIIVIDGIRK